MLTLMTLTNTDRIGSWHSQILTELGISTFWIRPNNNKPAYQELALQEQRTPCMCKVRPTYHSLNITLTVGNNDAILTNACFCVAKQQMLTSATPCKRNT